MYASVTETAFSSLLSMWSNIAEMARQRKHFALFLVVFLATTSLLSEVSSISIPRVLSRSGSPWGLKRASLEELTPEQRQQDENCRDKRPDCDKLIDRDWASIDCEIYKGQCDRTCEVCRSASSPSGSSWGLKRAFLEGLTPKQRQQDAWGGPICENLIIDQVTCEIGLITLQCRRRKYKEGCAKTCCNCDELHPNCN